MRDFECMPLAVMPQAWDHPDWIWEIKYDGFRSLACVESGKCRLVSRKHIPYKAFPSLEAAILATFDRDVVLDGEIVCLDQDGCPQFYDLVWHRAELWFYAFDVLYLHGRDLRSLPLVERDLEGVVAKHKDGLYTPEATTRVKVKNPQYSQGRPPGAACGSPASCHHFRYAIDSSWITKFCPGLAQVGPTRNICHRVWGAGALLGCGWIQRARLSLCPNDKTETITETRTGASRSGGASFS